MIVGLDTASQRWHAVVLHEGQTDLAKCECPDKGIYKHWTVDQRRQKLCEEFAEFIEWLEDAQGVDEDIHIFCEESQAFGKNGKTTRWLNLACGALWAMHLGHSVFWYWVDPSQWKAMIGSSGKKKKEATRIELEWCLQDGAEPGWDEDHYDAYCLAKYGEKMLIEAMLRGDGVSLSHVSN